MIRHLLKGTDFSPIRATQLFLTFESHVIRDEGEQSGGGNFQEFQSNIILAALERWLCAIKTWCGPRRREKGMGGLTVAPSHHKFSLGQLGGHGCPTAIAYKQEGMDRQRGCKEFPKATGQRPIA